MAIMSEEVIFHGLNHQIRREILYILNNSPKTFSELLNYFDISSGKLDYHLKQIKGFIKKNDKNTYELTILGNKALEILSSIRKELTYNERGLLKEAYISQIESSRPIILQGINLGIGGIAFIMGITIFLIIVFILVQDSPIFVWPILITMLAGETIGLIWTFRLRKAAPVFMDRISKHLMNGD